MTGPRGRRLVAAAGARRSRPGTRSCLGVRAARTDEPPSLAASIRETLSGAVGARTIKVRLGGRGWANVAATGNAAARSRQPDVGPAPGRLHANRLHAKGCPAVAIERDAHEQADTPNTDGQATSSTDGHAVEHSAAPGTGGEASPPHRATLRVKVGRLILALRDGDNSTVEDAILQLSRSHRLLAPLALVVGAVAMLFEGLKLLFSNWRLTLVQVLPAMWIWAAMLDLKAHLLHGKTLLVLRGPVLVPLVLAIAAITAASFFLNAVFAFAIVRPHPLRIRPAFAEARSHLAIVLGSGAVVGLFLGLSTMVFTRWGLWWFAVSLSIVIAVMMLCYVTVPSRLVGMKTTYSKRDNMTATVVGGAIGAVVCTPPYLLGRIGILMLGSHTLFIPGIFVLTLGFTLQAGATGAVKAIKMSAKLVAGRR